MICSCGNSEKFSVLMNQTASIRCVDGKPSEIETVFAIVTGVKCRACGVEMKMEAADHADFWEHFSLERRGPIGLKKPVPGAQAPVATKTRK